MVFDCAAHAPGQIETALFGDAARPGAIASARHGTLYLRAIGELPEPAQARLLDLLRGLVRDLGLAAIVVTHDLAVARLLSDRMIVMKDGRMVEHGLTDRVLDDPRAPYTQLLVSSILQV